MDKDLKTEVNKRLAKAIDQVIDQQIAENEPPETAETLERLLEDGFSESQAMDLIGRVVSHYISEVILQKKIFDMKGYCEALEDLPDPYEVKPEGKKNND